MKLITNGETVAVEGIPSIGAGDIRIPLASAPTAIGDTVQLQRDDGFVLASYTVADYLHPRVKDGVIILSNTPEPEPVTPPKPVTPDDPIGDLSEVVAELTDRVVNLELK